MPKNLISIPVPIIIPYGKEREISVYVRDSDGNEKNITPYLYQHKITQRINQLWFFSLTLLSVSDDDKADWIKKNHEILIFWGSQIRMKGRIEKIKYDNYEQCFINGVGMAVRLRDQDLTNEYLNTASSTIVTNINNSIMTVDTNTDFGLISMHYQSENRLKALAGTAKAIDYDWWEDWKSADSYVTDYINVDSSKGDSGVTTTTFYTSGSNQNAHIVEDEEDTYGIVNYVQALGYGDGTNQLKAISFHATDNRTTLAKQLDARLASDVDGETETIPVVDDDGIDDGDTIRIDGETMTVSGTPSSDNITVTARTGKPSHYAGADVIKTAGKIHCVDTSSLPSPSGNVWIGQEKISYSANASNDLTMTSREVAYSHTGIVKAYYHGKKIEVLDAQYTTASPEAGSHIATDGIRSRTFTDTTIIDQNVLDYSSQRIRIKRQENFRKIKVATTEAYEVLVTTNLQVGDYIELFDTYTGFETGTRYEVVGMVYGFDVERAEFCDLEISNRDMAFEEETTKETGDMGKYYKGATNIFEVSDSENCDKTHPLILPFRIPTDTVAINKFLGSYSVGDYRAYSSATNLTGLHTHSVSGITSGSGSSAVVAASALNGWADVDSSDNWVTVHTYNNESASGFLWCFYISVANEDVAHAGTIYARIYNNDTSEYYPDSTGMRSIIDANGVGGTNYSTAEFFILVPGDQQDDDLEVQLKCKSDDLFGYVKRYVIGHHTHSVSGQTAQSDGAHSHSVTFGITDHSSEADGMNIHVDNGDGNWQAASGNPYPLDKDQDIDITSLVGRETGWKRLRFTPTDAGGEGKCKITGIGNVQVFIQSKV